MSLLEPGSRIVDRYIVQSRLGSGGMATVYHCVDATNNQGVAIKLLHGHLLADNIEIVERFKRESAVMAHLSQPTAHPNIVAVHTVIHRPDLMAIVMELVEGGGTLEEYMAAQGPQSEAEATRLLSGVLAGLQFVHERGIIHRDLKPSNILLTTDAQGQLLAKIADFGIAGVETQQIDMTSAGTLTHTESMFGSPAFMAPELFDSATAASEQSDVYALGVILYQLLTGELPFVVDSMPSHVMRVSTQPAPSPRTVREMLSGDIERVVAVALAKDAAERFQSAQAFLDALQGRGVDAFGEGMRTSDVDPERIGKDYKVVRRIGRGPVANVFQCVDESLGVPFAVKLLRGNDDGRRSRFVSEAKSQNQLHQGRPHMGIVAIRHMVIDATQVALVEDYVDGLSIERYVAEARPDLATILRLFTEASDALSHAHRLGVLHRNLKPANLLVTWSGEDAAARRRPRLKISDFGMEQVAGLPRIEMARRTGTRAYLAPELFDESAASSTSSDVYALSALLLLGLLGRLPNEVRAGGDLRPYIPETLSERLGNLLQSGLAPNPMHRPSADEFRSVVEKSLNDLTGEQSPLDTGPVSPMEPLPDPQPQKSPIVMWVIVALVIVGGAAGVAWVVASSSKPETQKETAAEETPPVEDVSEGEPDLVQEPTFNDVSADVAKLFAENTDVVSECLKQSFSHERAKELTSASGTLKIKTLVDSAGAVTSVEVVRDDLEIIEFGSCVSARMEAWTFPASGREETWEKEWIF